MHIFLKRDKSKKIVLDKTHKRSYIYEFRNYIYIYIYTHTHNQKRRINMSVILHISTLNKKNFSCCKIKLVKKAHKQQT